MAGTDPTVAEDVFTATIAIVDGAVSVSWQPRLSAAEEARRIYTRYGKNRLEDAWGPVTPASQFFKVGVQMK